jgi:hypothetical protein
MTSYWTKRRQWSKQASSYVADCLNASKPKNRKTSHEVDDDSFFCQSDISNADIQFEDLFSDPEPLTGEDPETESWNGDIAMELVAWAITYHKVCMRDIVKT